MSVSTPEKDNSVSAQLNAFEIAPGYEIGLFADETDGVANPVCMQWDGKGRLWVLTTLAYPQVVPTDAPDDTLLILEDRDGDGRADQTTIFARGLNMPTGFALGHGGVYIGEGNDLIFVEDRDGDGQADSRRVLLTGFGTGDTHQNINSFAWSPGGELLFCQGLHAFSRVETPWGISRLDEHGNWRLRPLRRQLHGFRRTSGGGNPWGIAFGDWGEPFIKSNGPGVSELLPGLVQTEYIGSYWGGAMEIGKTQIKSMMVEIVDSPHLPEDIQGHFLIAGYFAGVVDRFGVKTEGAGHKLELLPQLLRSNHNAFRPVDVRIGPDGAIYVADWFNPIIGHYQASLRHPDRDKTHGRIWRIAAQGRPLAAAPDFTKMTPAELCRNLAEDWRYLRYHAKRGLADLPASQALAAVEEWVAQLDPADPQLEYRLFEALGVYESHEAVNRDLLDRLLAAKDHRARAYATRVAGRWHDRLDAPLQILARSVADEHPRVRLEAVVACSDIRSAESMVTAAKATDLPMDRFIRYALAQTSHALAPHWLPALERGEIQFGRPENLTFVLRSYGGEDVVTQVRRLLQNEALDADSRASLMGLLVETGTPQDLRWILDRTGDDSSLLAALARDFQVRGQRPAGDLAATLTPMLANENAQIRQGAIRLAGLWKTNSLAGQISQIFGDEEESAELRATALRAHGRLRGDQSIVEIAAAAGDSAPKIRHAAVRALCELDLAKAAEIAGNLLRNTSTEDEIRSLLTPFLGQKGGLAALANALGTETVAPQLATQIRATLGAAGRFDPALDRVLRPAADKDAVGLPEHSETYVATLAAEVKTAGNAENGAQIYQRAALSCAACHKLDEAGGVLGPELTAVGAGVPVELLIEAVLWPRRQIKEGYSATLLTTKDGKTISGYVEREDKQRVMIRDAASGVTQTIAKNRVASRQDAGTLMPPGLTAGLTRGELRDLVRYLSELTGDG